MDQYDVLRTFYDIEGGPLSPGQTQVFTSTTPYMTPNTITGGSSEGYSREITSMEIIPPVDSQGRYEDLREVWLILDDKDYQHYINVPGWGWTLMTPPRSQIWGGESFQSTVGRSFGSVCAGGGPNMPLEATGLKYSKTISVAVRTVYGVTGKWRIRLKGYQYSPAALAYYAPKWRGTVDIQTPDRILEQKPALTFSFPISTINPETWTALPGGPLQGSVKVNPYWRFAFNATATQPQSPFVLSNFPEVSGGSGYVEDPYQELSFRFAANLNAFLLRGYGVRPVPFPPGTPVAGLGYPTSSGNPIADINANGANLARVGWWIGGTLVPEETGNQGQFVTNGVNDLAWGDLRPFVNLPYVFRRLPRYHGQLLIY
ncbi:MAG: hypothetical protein OWV35_00600, partial [Firmicutes bacterium]|nr:hypothetical protein [Bacillota bacterium]